MSETVITERRSNRSPTWVDAFIGRRLQQRRIEIGMSQHQLADEIGLSFQQIQKFETGMNRIPASRLADIATVLKAPPGDFFPATDAPRRRRSDLIRAQGVIDDLIARHKESLEDLRRLQRCLGELALQPAIDIAREITGTRWSGPAFFGLTAVRESNRGSA